MTSESCEASAYLSLLKARLAAVGMTRRSLSRATGISYFRIQAICGGSSTPGKASKRLIEIAVAMPIWSTPEQFSELTRLLRRDAEKSCRSAQTTICGGRQHANHD